MHHYHHCHHIYSDGGFCVFFLSFSFPLVLVQSWGDGGRLQVCRKEITGLIFSLPGAEWPDPIKTWLKNSSTFTHKAQYEVGLGENKDVDGGVGVLFVKFHAILKEHCSDLSGTFKTSKLRKHQHVLCFLKHILGERQVNLSCSLEYVSLHGCSTHPYYTTS